MIVCLILRQTFFIFVWMRFLLFYRIVFKVVLAIVFPLALFAGEKEIIDKPVNHELMVNVLPLFTDTIPPKKKTDTRQEEQPEEKPRDIQDDRLDNPERRAIKQVPRSIPKLKPQPVGERIKIRRPPPIKLPKKGFRGYRF
jgi:hypothetical protein